MVLELASADYRYEQDICYNSLKNIIRTRNLPLIPEPILIECLNLTKWTKPKNKNDYVLTAFSTMLLLILEGEDKYVPDCDGNSILVVFLDSTLNLNINPKYIQEFIAWIILANYNQEKECFLKEGEPIDEITIDSQFLIYTLMLILIFNSHNEKEVNIIADWLLDMDKFNKNIPPFYSKEKEGYRNKYPRRAGSERFFSGLEYYNQKLYLWKKMNRKMIQEIEYIKSNSLILKLKNIFNQLEKEEI